jgi:sterol desaturase/sphingolipid hydroxylase (fatty acid hydroxylase superfamily)
VIAAGIFVHESTAESRRKDPSANRGRNRSAPRSLRSRQNDKWRTAVLGTILIIIVILLLIGALPRWGYSTGWGYGPSGLLGLILIIVIILLLTGNL